MDTNYITPEVRKERLLKLAETVEHGYYPFNGIKAAFNMSSWLVFEDTCPSREHFLYSMPNRSDITPEAEHSCNTIACLAGFAIMLFDKETTDKAKNDRHVSYERTARKLLGLNDLESRELFVGRIDSRVTGAEAAKVVRHFAETGQVDWDIISKPYEEDNVVDDHEDDDEI